MSEPDRGSCPKCGADFMPEDDENFPGWECGSYQMDGGRFVQEDDCKLGELKLLRAKIERIATLAKALPNDNGDPPTTDYQHGYMDACKEAVRQISAVITP